MHYDEIWLIIPVTPFYLSTECLSCLLHLLDALAFFAQGCHVQGKYPKNEIFSRSGKSQGILWMARDL